MEKRLILARFKQQKYREVLEGWTVEQILALPPKEQKFLLQYADELTGHVRKGEQKLNNWRVIKETRTNFQRQQKLQKQFTFISYEDWRQYEGSEESQDINERGDD